MWPGAREAGSADGERERRPPQRVLSDPLLPAPAFTFPGTKLRGHRSKAKESQVRTYTCTHTADRAGAQGHGDLEGLCRTPPSPGLPTPSTPRRRGAEGGLERGAAAHAPDHTQARVSWSGDEAGGDGPTCSWAQSREPYGGLGEAQEASGRTYGASCLAAPQPVASTDRTRGGGLGEGDGLGSRSQMPRGHGLWGRVCPWVTLTGRPAGRKHPSPAWGRNRAVTPVSNKDRAGSGRAQRGERT